MRMGGILLLLSLVGCQVEGRARWSIGHVGHPGYAPAATSITPITSLAAPAAGFPYSGESYDVSCAVSGSVTLYPVVHNGAAWEPPYLGYGCTLDDGEAPKGTCTFPARQGTGLLWNAWKTGAGSVSSCTATPRQGPVPASPRSSGGSGGTVTSIDCDTGLTCTPDPITSTGTIAIANTGVTAATYGSATQVPRIAVNAQGQIASASNVTISGVAPGGAAGGALAGTYPNPSLASVVAADTCAYPASVTYNEAGQVTACIAGSAPGIGTIYGGQTNSDSFGAATVYLGAVGTSSFTGSQVSLGTITRTGTIGRLSVSIRTAPGGSDTVVATAQKSSNQGSTWTDTTLTCTITGAAKTCTDTEHTPPVALYDWIAIKLVSSAGVAAGPTTAGMEVN